MNNQLKETYSNIRKFLVPQDFVNLNMDSFTYREGVTKKSCKIHIIVLMLNHLLGETNDEVKLTRNFNRFGDEYFDILTKSDRIFHSVLTFLEDN